MDTPEQADKKAAEAAAGAADDLARQCPVVAIGASAGGLEVFKTFFEHMPIGSGLAFVLVQHLDPAYQSMVPHLLRGHTQMPVKWVEDGLAIEPETIYVVPSGTLAGVDNCSFALSRLPDELPRLRSIDENFQTLASGLGKNLIGVIASGLGTDGTVGLYAVKEHGGLALAQSSPGASHGSMPANAISAGLVDVVVPVQEMPRHILDYVRTLAAAPPDGMSLEEVMPEIFQVLASRSGHDFSEYKDSTLLRRVQRRMRVCHCASPAEYLEALRAQPAEAENLFKDLLIGVTRFFRDRAAFKMLRAQVIDPLVEKAEDGGEVRAWVAGCASGEEAYSLGMLFIEARERAGKQVRIQIFATDLDGRALEIARRGVFEEPDVTGNVSEERRKRFFTKRGGAFEVVPELRKICSFSPHNLVKDPPFSRLDLISCRNVLIYLEPDLQRRLLPLFHFALKPHGYLFLGPSEHLARHSEHFAAVDQKNRIFQRKPAPLRTRFHAVDHGGLVRSTATETSNRPVLQQQPFSRMVERVLLEDYSPAAAVINDRGEALYFSGKAGRFLEMPSGAPTTNVVGMARRGLRLELRTAIHRAVTTGEEVRREKITVSTNTGPAIIDLVVRPMPELGDQGPVFIVIFQEVVPMAAAGMAADPAPIRPDDGEAGAWSILVQQLENELQSAKEDLQATIEELETSNEELQSANEELLSMNEELQSANEELQSSKEELQSVNDELERTVEELDAGRVDLQNLLAVSELAAVFLDASLRIKMVTPAAASLVAIGQERVGQSLTQASASLRGSDLEQGIQRVLQENTSAEQQLYLENEKRWLLVRLMPYRVQKERAEGVVLSFFDITRLKQTQQDLQKANVTVYRVLDRIADGFIAFDREWRVTYVNQAARGLLPDLVQREADDLIGCQVWQEFPELVGSHIYQLYHEAFESGVGRVEEVYLDIAEAWLELRIYPGRDGISVYFRDITSEREAREALASSQERLELALEAGQMGAWDWEILEERIIWSGAMEEIHGFDPGTFPGTLSAFEERLHPEDRERVMRNVEEASLEASDLHHDYRIIRPDGEVRWVEAHGRLQTDEEGKAYRMTGICADVTRERQAKEALREAQAKLGRHATQLEKLVEERTSHLRETIDSLESVCYTIAHDLRAPLRTLQGFTQILVQKYGGDFDEEGSDLAERMVQAAMRMDALIRDLLSYARLSHGALPVGSLDVEAEVHGIIAHLREEISAVGGEVVVKPLPPIRGNHTVLEQVMTNLITNALKFRRAGVPPRVEISGEMTSTGRVRLCIRDNGIGIPPEYHDRIFGLFQRLHGQGSYPGTGIGLSIVRKGVERMGGSVVLESRAGEGTAFYLDLPAMDDLA